MSQRNSRRSRKQTERSQAWKTLQNRQPRKLTADGSRKISVPHEPPSVNPSPWMCATVARLLTAGEPPLTTGLLQSTDVINWLTDQLDPDRKYLPRAADGTADTTKPLYYRLESIMAWNLTGKTIALNTYDLQTGDVNKYSVADEDYESLGSWFDSCSGNSPPRVGFRWPSSNRQKILSNHLNKASGYGEGLRHLCNILAPKGDQLMIHLRLYWRFPATGKEMLASIIGLMDVHSAITSVENAVMTRASLGLQRKIISTQKDIYSALPGKVLGAARVWVENKILPDKTEGDDQPSTTRCPVGVDTPTNARRSLSLEDLAVSSTTASTSEVEALKRQMEELAAAIKDRL